jgi:hypothetical protein
MGSSSSKAQTTSQNITATDRAVLQLKITRDQLNKYKSKLAIETTKLEEQARIYKHAGNTKGAINCLKLKKIKAKHIDNVYESLLNVQSMIDNIHNKEQEASVLNALNVGKQELAKLHSVYSLEKVMDIMDGVREQNELEDEINRALVNMGEDLVSETSQELLEQELMEMMEAENGYIQETEPKNGDDLRLPVAPQTALPGPDSVEAQKEKVPSTRVAIAS